MVKSYKKTTRSYTNARSAVFTIPTRNGPENARRGAGSTKVAISRSQLTPKKIKNMIKNKEVEKSLRHILESEGYKLEIPERKYGETGVDIIASKDGEEWHIEVIGYKKSPPARSKDFYEVFFRSISRLKDGAKNVVIALPERFRKGLPQRVQQYGIAWQRIGTAFPELEIWFVDIENNKLKKTKWSDCM